MGRRPEKSRRWQTLCLLLFLTTAAAGPLLFNNGFLNTRGGGDSPFLLFRVQQLLTAIKDGHLPVRWMPDAAYGYGFPFFSYYAAFPYYLAASLAWGGWGLVAALKLTQWLGFLVAAWSMGGLVFHFSRNRTSAWLAATAYTFAPYHLVNVYVRGDALSEFWAMGLAPLVLWMAAQLWEEPDRKNLIRFVLSYAALVLTHNVSALMFSAFLLLFVCIMMLGDRGSRNNKRASIGLSVVGIIWGLSLASFFWLPALGEQSAVQLLDQTSGYFHYSNHFRSFAGSGHSLVQPSFFFDYDVAGGTPFSMGLVQLLLTGVGLGLIGIRGMHSLKRSLIGQRRTDRKPAGRSLPQGRTNLLLLYAIATLLIATLMITPLSTLLWEWVPLLPLVQFPWRFLAIQALATSILIGAISVGGARSIEGKSSQAVNPRSPGSGSQFGSRSIILQYTPIIAIMVLLLGSALFSLKPDFVRLLDADVTGEKLQLYEWFSGNVGTTIRYEYLPQAVVPRLYTSPAIVNAAPLEGRTISGKARVVRLEQKTASSIWQVDVDSEHAEVSFPILYWPGWNAQVDGKDVPLEVIPGMGTIALVLPSGNHLVSLTLGRTPLRLAAELISLSALLACVSVAIGRHSQWRKQLSKRSFLSGLGVTLLVLLAVWLTGFVLRRLELPATVGTDLTWDFDQQAYLHHNPSGVRFGEVATLVSYSTDDGRKDRHQAGDPLHVSLNWSDVRQDDLKVELALVHPAQVVHKVPYTLVSSVQSLDSDGNQFDLAIPQDLPPGPFLLRLSVLDASGNSVPALTSAGNRRGDLYLNPVWFEVYARYDGPAQIELLDVEATQLAPELLQVRLNWGVGKDQSANYKVSLRLVDANGYEWAALDTQPGYGFYPTTAWQAGTAFHEQYTLDIPYGLAPGDYTLTILLYDATTLQPRWGPEIHHLPISMNAPYDGRSLAHIFTPDLAATDLTMPERVYQGEWLSSSFSLVNLGNAHQTLLLSWTLLNGEGRRVAGSEEEFLSQLPGESLVLVRLAGVIDPVLPSGTYQVIVRLEDAVLDREIGESWQAGELLIVERPRQFIVPEVETKIGARFGDLFRLEGINLSQQDDRIEMTLFWQSLAATDDDYIVFVHLFDPTTEQIVVQHDAMPRANRYPTSRWLSGEVVNDPIVLPLDATSPGRYQIAIGLYRIVGDQYPRLPVTGSMGTFSDGRLILPGEIVVE